MSTVLTKRQSQGIFLKGQQAVVIELANKADIAGHEFYYTQKLIWHQVMQPQQLHR